MVQKLRKTMGIRDGEYHLGKIVELYEGFFESIDSQKTDEEKLDKRKRSRGSQKQSKVIVMASTAHPLKEPEKHRKPTKFRYVIMKVVKDLKAETIEQLVIKNLVPFELV